MRRVFNVFAAASLLGLAACGGSGGDEPAPMKSTKAAEAKNAGGKDTRKAAEKVRLAAGRWEATVKLEKLDLGNVPAQVRQAIETGVQRETRVISCLSQDEAEKPDADFFSRNNGDCVYDEYSAKGGRIEAKMTCSGADGSQTVSLSGNIEPESYAMTMSMSGSAGNGMPMLMTMSMDGHRTGECKGDEKR